MELREIQRSDYNLILALDAKVYPVSEENKINAEIIDRWYNAYPKYGMVYTNGEEIVAMAIAIPMPMSTWYKLIRGECFENTLDIDWASSTSSRQGDKTSIGLHIYHIEVLHRSTVGTGFYQRMLNDIAGIARHYHHRVDGFSGYCVTPQGNRLFQSVLRCRSTDQDHASKTTIPTTAATTTTTTTTPETDDTTTEWMSEFIIQHPVTKKLKIVECPWNTDLTQPYLDQSVEPPQPCPFLSKCNMLYTVRETDTQASPVWNSL